MKSVYAERKECALAERLFSKPYKLSSGYTIMALLKQIDLALGKSSGHIVSSQKPNGSWADHHTHGEPPQMKKPITSLANEVVALSHVMRPEFAPCFAKALNSALNFETFPEDPLELWAFKMEALQFANTNYANKEKERIANFIKKQQKKDGSWPTFPKNFYLTNHRVVTSISTYPQFYNAFNKVRKWFLKNKAKDNFGWGFTSDSEKSEASHTANTILSLLFVGEDPQQKDMQMAKKFLESRQFPDGGWASSRLTVHDKPTIYSTGATTLALLLLSDDLNSKSVLKGIKFLLDNQLENGGWPLVKGEKESELYSGKYAIETLAFYKFLVERLNSYDMLMLAKKLSPQEINRLLWFEFKKAAIERVKDAFLQSVLNSEFLGATSDAISRRKDILKILSASGQKDIAGIIDSLKENEAYAELNKRSHMTLVKNDMDHLRSVSLVFESEGKYFVVADLL
jgi:hypothetical protein